MFCAQPVLAAQLTNDLPERWTDLDLEAEDGAWAGRLGPGGHYRPHGCVASTRVAILIPDTIAGDSGTGHSICLDSFKNLTRESKPKFYSPWMILIFIRM